MAPSCSASKKILIKRLFLVSAILFLGLFSNWLATRATEVELPSSKTTLLYSNQTGTDLQLLFLEALSSAKQSIYLEMYAITDPTILKLLAAKISHGIKVFIHTDKKASPGIKRKLPASIHEGRGLMHRKVVVIDDELVLLGSTNFTTASLKMHDNIVFATKNSNLASFFQKNEAPWQYASQDLTVWKLPESGKSALDAACQLLSSAKKTIKVAMFTFTHMKLAEKLVEAKNRGVDVQVALDHYTKEGSSKAVAQFLSEHGIPVMPSQGVQLLHHKWALIDEEILLAGSANWTQSAFKKNKDLLFMLALTDDLKERMQKLWEENLSQ